LEAKSAKGDEEAATGGGFELFGDFAPNPAGTRTREVLTDCKIQSLKGKFLWCAFYLKNMPPILGCLHLKDGMVYIRPQDFCGDRCPAFRPGNADNPGFRSLFSNECTPTESV